MERVISDPIEKNPKGELQEILQSLTKEAPRYRVVNEHGPDHDRIFITEVYWNDMVLGEGKGKSKKESESQAARIAIEKKICDVKNL